MIKKYTNNTILSTRYCSFYGNLKFSGLIYNFQTFFT